MSSLDPLAADHRQCPHPVYRELRAHDPVAYLADRGCFVVTTHALCLDALRQPTVFKQWDGDEMFEPGQGPPLGSPANWAPEVRAIMADAFPPVSTLVTANPPRHTPYRKLANELFSARRTAEELAARIEALTDSLIDELPAQGTVDVVEHLALPLPAHVIADVLGVPSEEFLTIRRWADSALVGISGGGDPARLADAARDIVAFQRYFLRRLEEAREGDGDDLVSVLARAELGGERPLEPPEALGILLNLLTGGAETTASLLGSMLHRVLTEPGLADRALASAAALPAIVEEVLRLDSPVQAMFRRVASDTELGWVPIPAGAKVLLVFGSANRDDAAFERAEEMDDQRQDDARHLAFGFGTHFCLGAPLARKEAAVATRRVLQRLVRPRLAAEPLEWDDDGFFRSLRRLPVTYDAVVPAGAVR